MPNAEMISFVMQGLSHVLQESPHLCYNNNKLWSVLHFFIEQNISWGRGNSALHGGGGGGLKRGLVWLFFFFLT